MENKETEQEEWQHLGNSKENLETADLNLSVILNPIPNWLRQYRARQKEIMKEVAEA
jgi:hypothetical protein